MPSSAIPRCIMSPLFRGAAWGAVVLPLLLLPLLAERAAAAAAAAAADEVAGSKPHIVFVMADGKRSYRQFVSSAKTSLVTCAVWCQILEPTTWAGATPL